MTALEIRFCWSVLLAATLFSACDEDGGSSQECAPLQAAIGEAQTLCIEALSVFRSGFQAAIAEPPRAGTATCAVDVTRGLATHRAVQAAALGSFEPPKVRTVRGSIDSAELAVQDCEYLPSEARQRSVDDLQNAVGELRTGHDLIVLERSRVEPIVLRGTGTFTPGQLQAQLMVWSYAQSAVVCVAEASATNRSEVGISNQRLHSDYLNEDLDRQVSLTGARNLRAIAP